MKNLLNSTCHYLLQKSGSIGPMFGLMAPLLFVSIGGAIDISHGYLIKQRLSHALDAAALAAAASATESNDIKAKVLQFLDLNYPDDKIGDVHNIQVFINGDEVSASASADFDTYFLRLIGMNKIDVAVDTTVEREVQGIEVVLVLDVTGSMADEIDELEDSVEMFVNRLCKGSTCPANVKIGYVPFSTAVNVGPYGLGEDENGNYYDTPFVNNPTGREWDIGHFDEWRGCVMADRDHDTDLSYTGDWEMFRNTQAYATSGSYFNYNSYSHYNSYNKKHYYHYYNYLCNKSHIIPLTNDKGRLLAKADFVADGWTLGNLGMAWGLRVLLPDYPFTEGAPWSDNVTKRVIVMMTDGRNDLPDSGTSSTSFSAYGVAQSDNIDEGDLNDKFSDLCEQAKDDYNVNVYTITFSTGVDSYTEQLFETCASAPSNYYDVDQAQDLAGAYDKIAKELANLHIKN